MKGRCKVIAIKENIDLVPWAEVVYGCDAAWWVHRQGLPQFTGLKITYEGDSINTPPPFADIRRVAIDRSQDRLLFEKVGKTGAGGNSGFQALNLAIQFGSKDIILVGFDMHSRGGVHWYGKNRWFRANNPDETNFRRWKDAFATAAKQCRERGVRVVNCSLDSALECFPKMSLAEALA